jgi:hypothetical protein
VETQATRQTQTIRDEIFDRLDSAHVQVGRFERERLRAILECDRHDVWMDQGCRSHAEFLAGRYGISQWKARRWIGTAYALEHLPLTSHALETGRLGLDKVVELTRFATPATEKKLISWARRVTPGGVRSRADIELRVSASQDQEADRERWLDWDWRTDGRLGFEGCLPAAEGAKLVAAIDRLADKLPDIPGEDPSAPAEVQTVYQRRADALVLMCSARIAQDQDPDRATVVLHAPYESLVSGKKNSSLAGGHVVSPEVSRRLSCNGRLEVVLYGADGNVVGVGRAQHDPPRWLRRQVLSRDSHACTFPGCEMKQFLLIHHMHQWGAEGPTNLDNLVTVCSLHHKLVHDYGWRVTLDDSGSPVWFRPNGLRFEPGPAPPEDHPAPPPSTETAAWPAFFHAMESGENRTLSDPATKWLLKQGARRLATI